MISGGPSASLAGAMGVHDMVLEEAEWKEHTRLFLDGSWHWNPIRPGACGRYGNEVEEQCTPTHPPTPAGVK